MIDMCAKIQDISLEKKDEEELLSMLRRGKWSNRQLKRAQILLLAHSKKDLSNSEIAERLICGRETVRKIRYRYRKDGLRSALNEKPRSGQPRKVNPEDEKYLITLNTSKVPAGFSRWTLPLLAKRLLRERACKVSTETIRRILRRIGSG